MNVRPGEFVGAPPTQALVVVGDVGQFARPRRRRRIRHSPFPSRAPARASLKGQTKDQFTLTFVRVEPFVIPKKSLTGENTERVDTRVLPVIYELHTDNRKFFVGQQLDVYIEAESSDSSPGILPPTSLPPWPGKQTAGAEWPGRPAGRSRTAPAHFPSNRSPDQLAIEIVHAHAGVDDDGLGVDAAGAAAEQKGGDDWPLRRSQRPALRSVACSA